MRPRCQARSRRTSILLLLAALFLICSAAACSPGATQPASGNPAAERSQDRGTPTPGEKPSAETITPETAPELQAPSGPTADPSPSFVLPEGWSRGSADTSAASGSPAAPAMNSVQRLRHPEAGDKDFVVTVMRLPPDGLALFTLRTVVAEELRATPGITLTAVGITGTTRSDGLPASYIRYEGDTTPGAERYAAIQYILEDAGSRGTQIVTVAGPQEHASLVHALAESVVAQLETAE